MLVKYLLISEICLKNVKKNYLIDHHYKTKIRIFRYCRICPNPLMFLQGDVDDPVNFCQFVHLTMAMDTSCGKFDVNKDPCNVDFAPLL